MRYPFCGLPLGTSSVEQRFCGAYPAPVCWWRRLLERGASEDLAEADAAISRLVAAPTDDGLVAKDVMVLRLRALLAKVRGDEAAYRDYRDRYRAMATSLGFEGHMKWAEEMP